MDRETRAYLTVLYRQGQRIERALGRQEHELMALDDELATVQADEDAEQGKLDTLIAAFKNAGQMTPAQSAAFAAIEAEITGGSAEIDAANPPAVTPPVTPAA
jgi:hypothetical protein